MKPEDKRHIVRKVGVTLVTLGFLLLIGVVSFHLFGFYNYTRLDKLNAFYNSPLSLPDELEGINTAKDRWRPIDTSQYVRLTTSSAIKKNHNASLESSNQSFAFDLSNYESTYPGFLTHPKYWGQPFWAGTDAFVYDKVADQDIVTGFISPSTTTITEDDRIYDRGLHLQIPLINLTSPIEELRVKNLGTSKSYETPKHMVGHIVNSSLPGQLGNGWFFGHLESPIRGEGNVFKDLPQLANHLTDGDPVYIIVQTETSEYLYQAISSKVIHESELELYDTNDARITLVTCSNRPYYDYRQLITAKLIGIKQ
jgi:LPXTG-site transpeptidase (sortase) family protein